MKREVLLTPGPSPVPPEVLEALGRPISHHRTPEFRALQRETTEQLKRVLRTEHDAAILSASGTAGMEMAVVNLLGKGRKGLCVSGGKFGQRWGKICTAYGADHTVLEIEWGTAANAEQIATSLDDDPAITAVFTTLCETSTGALTDVEAIGRITREKEKLLIVDGISAAAADRIEMDAWGVDVLVVGSQKALTLPPGLAVVACGPRAFEAAQKRSLPAFYLDLVKAATASREGDSPFTPAISLIAGLNVALGQIEDEGIENVWARHARIAAAARSGALALGLGILPKSPANMVTVIRVPESVDGEALRKRMLDPYGVRVAGGQDELKGKIVRMAHMGQSCNEQHLTAGLIALERALKDCGHPVEPGTGVAAAVKSLSD